MFRQVRLPSGVSVSWQLNLTIKSAGTIFNPVDDVAKVSSGANDPALPAEAQAEDRCSVIATADIAHNHPGTLKVGFRQAAKMNGLSFLYAGMKPEDGSIMEYTTGLDGTWYIDSATRADTLEAPMTPYQSLTADLGAATTTAPKKHKLVDEPASQAQTRRYNSKRRKWNYLIGLMRSQDFLSVLYVEDIQKGGVSAAVPIVAFSWKYAIDVEVPWVTGFPLKPLGKNALSHLGTTWEKIDALPGFSRINVARASPADNINKIQNDAMKAARLAQASQPLYAFEVFEGYSNEVQTQLRAMRDHNTQFYF